MRVRIVYVKGNEASELQAQQSLTELARSWMGSRSMGRFYTRNS